MISVDLIAVVASLLLEGVASSSCTCCIVVYLVTCLLTHWLFGDRRLLAVAYHWCSHHFVFWFTSACTNVLGAALGEKYFKSTCMYMLISKGQNAAYNTCLFAHQISGNQLQLPSPLFYGAFVPLYHCCSTKDTTNLQSYVSFLHTTIFAPFIILRFRTLQILKMCMLWLANTLRNNNVAQLYQGSIT